MKINITYKQEIFLENFKHTMLYVFQALLFLFLITLLLREFYPLYIDSKVNINWFMVVVIVFGAISILFPPKTSSSNENKKQDFTLKDKLLIILLGIAGGVIIFLKLQSLGWIGYVISILGGLIIILLSWLIFEEEDKPLHESS